MNRRTYSKTIERLRSACFVESWDYAHDEITLRIYRTKTSGTYGPQVGAILWVKNSNPVAYGWTGGCGYNKTATVIEMVFRYFAEDNIEALTAKQQYYLDKVVFSLAGSGRHDAFTYFVHAFDHCKKSIDGKPSKAEQRALVSIDSRVHHANG